MLPAIAPTTPYAGTSAPTRARRTARVRRPIPGLGRLRTVIRQSRRHGLWIALWSIIGWVGTALAPGLTNSPFLLMVLSPRAVFVALASSSVSLLPFVLVGTLRLCVTDASYYIIGRRFPRSVDKAPSTDVEVSRLRRRIRRLLHEGDRLCRWFCRHPRLAGAFLFVRPNGKYLGVAGAYGVSPVIAGVSAVTGTAVFLTCVHVGIGAFF